MRGSGEEDRNVRGEGKEQGSENEGGGGGRENLNKAFMSSCYPLVIILPITCQQGWYLGVKRLECEYYVYLFN